MKDSIFSWYTPITFRKIFGKITQMIKSAQHSNFRNTFLGSAQKLTADL